MATVLLSAAGSAIGGAAGGTVLGLGAATLGQAAGAVAGSLIDQTILGSGSAAVDTGRARSLRIQTSTEGAAVPQLFGRMRVAGQIIWSTRFRENVRTTTQGGKATSGQRVNEFSYTISCAVGLCEGPIERLGRVWADGKLLDLSEVNHRIYLGDETQVPDPKIEAVEGAGSVPAHRGLAYVVFEDLPLGSFGNRIPQLNFEVFRNSSVALSGAQAGEPLSSLIKAVSLSPGTGEFALDPEPARAVFPAGGGQFLNINNAIGKPDILAALDQLEQDLPDCETVSLVVSWFGNDLRCGHCKIEPRTEDAGRTIQPEPWSVAGQTASIATEVSHDANDRPNFGGTPSDSSVIRAMSEMNARGLKVVLYPFLLMDIPEGNGLADPYGRPEQPAFPWRGRITLDAAPGESGSIDQTPAAGADVAAFFGTASASDFSVQAGSVVYTGPNEWTWRRFILHTAALGLASGGVDTFCIGTELPGLTTIRSAKADFPAVQHLIALAAEVRMLLPDTRITYAADWSEYFGYHPADGTGDVLFHLDALWADSNIDLVGIDDYTPLSDWRHSSRHLDAEAKTIYSLPYLKSQVEGGEYYDYFYASQADRQAQIRTPITDGAHGETFIFRPKDIRGWWENLHHNRIDGVRDAAPTPWVPQSKPVWLTETGCPAVDLGANKPNLFLDAKSSESALPVGSRGARDDEMQRRFLQAKLGYWADAGNNPISAVYDGPMIPPEGVIVWTWDARPWPDFPVRESLWSDGPAHRLGHWVTGRVTAGALAEVVSEICLRSGLAADDFDVSGLFGVVDGYIMDRTQTAREALQPLMQAFGFDALESGGQIRFVTRQAVLALPLAGDLMVPGPGSDGAPVLHDKTRSSKTPDTIRFSYVQSENDYRVGTAEARLPNGPQSAVSETSLQVALPGSRAQQITERWLAEALRGLDTVSFTLPPSAYSYEPGDIVQLEGPSQRDQFRIDRITDTGVREIEAVRIEPSLYLPTAAAERVLEPEALQPPGPVTALFMDLPLASGDGTDHQPHIAVNADPWPGEVAVYRSDSGDGFSLFAQVKKPAFMGVSQNTLPAGRANRWQRVQWSVVLPAGAVSSADRVAVLNGANRLAVQHVNGEWEIIQFQQANLVGTDLYELSLLLRGQRGTAALASNDLPATARVVVLDDALVRLPVLADERGLARTWRVGPSQLGLASPAFVESVEIFGGIGLRPFAPAHARVHKVAGDLVISWIRSTRIGGESLASVDVPLGEDREEYRVSILSGGGVLRVIDVTEPAAIYTTQMQTEDGATGALDISIAQLSTAFGYGAEKVIRTNV